MELDEAPLYYEIRRQFVYYFVRSNLALRNDSGRLLLLLLLLSGTKSDFALPPRYGRPQNGAEVPAVRRTPVRQRVPTGSATPPTATADRKIVSDGFRTSVTVPPRRAHVRTVYDRCYYFYCILIIFGTIHGVFSDRFSFGTRPEGAGAPGARAEKPQRCGRGVK